MLSHTGKRGSTLALAILIGSAPSWNVWSQNADQQLAQDTEAKQERRGLRDRLRDALDRDDGAAETPPSATRALPTATATAIPTAGLPGGTAPNSLDADRTLVDNTNAAALAAGSCLQDGQQDEAAKIALVFGGGGSKGLVQSDLSSYLVGLCIPNNFISQYQMNEYLLARGAVHSFYAERSLEELATYLQGAGVELAVQYDALQKDSAVAAALGAENDMNKAGYIFNQNRPLSDGANLFGPAIAGLKEEQRDGARQIAARARSHALRSAFFLARGVYVSQKMAETVADTIKSDQGPLARARQILRGSDPSSLLTEGGDVFRQIQAGGNKEMMTFTTFVSKNGKAVAGTLGSVTTVIRSFDTSAEEIPTLTDEALQADAERLNSSWDLPPEFLGADVYAAANAPAAQ